MSVSQSEEQRHPAEPKAMLDGRNPAPTSDGDYLLDQQTEILSTETRTLKRKQKTREKHLSNKDRLKISTPRPRFIQTQNA